VATRLNAPGPLARKARAGPTAGQQRNTEAAPRERVRSALRAASASCPSTAIRQRRSMFASPSSD